MAYKSIFANEPTPKTTPVKPTGYKSIFGDTPAPTPKVEKTATLPSFLGGGEYKIGVGAQDKELKSQDVIAEKEGAQRDHQFPYQLGGTNTGKNVMYRDAESARKLDQVETQAIRDYKAGKINLNQARLRVITAKQEEDDKAKGINQGVMANLPSAAKETAANFAKGVFNFFTSSSQKFGETLGTAASVVDEQTGANREQIIKDAEAQSKKFMAMARQATDKKKKVAFLKAASDAANTAGIDIYNNPEYQKTTKQVLGEAAGTALEILTMGSYGAEAKGLQSFKIGKALPTVAKGAEKAAANLTAKQIIKESAKEAVKVGAPLGAAFGTASAMQENKGFIDTLKEAGTAALAGAVLQFSIGAGLRGLSSASEKIGPIGKGKTEVKINPQDVHENLLNEGTVEKGPNKNFPTIKYDNITTPISERGERVIAQLETTKTGEHIIRVDKTAPKNMQAEAVAHIHEELAGRKFGESVPTAASEIEKAGSIDVIKEALAKDPVKAKQEYPATVAQITGEPEIKNYTPTKLVDESTQKLSNKIEQKQAEHLANTFDEEAKATAKSGASERAESAKIVGERTGEKMVETKLPADQIKFTNPVKDTEGVAKIKSEIQSGVDHPIVVEHVDGEYRVVDGQRTLTAHKELGTKEVKVLVNESGVKKMPKPSAKITESIPFQRMKERLPADMQEDLMRNRLTFEESAKIAADIISTDEKKAYRIAMGAEEAPANTSRTFINGLLTEKALEAGDNKLAADLMKNRALHLARQGQEIVTEKANVMDNSAQKYIKQVIQERLNKYRTGMLSAADLIKEKITGQKVKIADRVSKEVAVAEKFVNKKKFDLKNAQAFLDSLACK